ncbi:hypothetical protein [Burkholderia plantarii]|uniref:hypothetical protein n=1 Tax=Burkholderia plantarii TaxID=41899 RepID=UPI0018DE6B71|nr:hypothetical protein [Burkholderia plantarii]MBI0325754.1 hypothetical protein [Burkholderia plantarii]
MLTSKVFHPPRLSPRREAAKAARGARRRRVWHAWLTAIWQLCQQPEDGVAMRKMNR